MRSHHSRFRTPAYLVLVVLALLLICATVSAGAGGAGSGQTGNSALAINTIASPEAAEHAHGLMHLTKDQLALMQAQTDASPKYKAPKNALLASQSSPTGVPTGTYPATLSLFSYLPTIPSQRNQGSCGNCWAWASNGVLEVDHTVNTNTLARLSVQYFDSKYYSTGHSSACCGGWLSSFVSWYNSDKSPVPWTNRNASYADGSNSCSYAPKVLIGDIQTTPAYGMNSISYSTISTYGVSNATAITNIQSALNNKKAVWYSFFMPSAGWSSFNSFWSSGAGTAQFDPSIYSGQTQAGGHAVIIVGYDTTDPNNPYWIVVNSWGTTANRPDGTYRLKMDMNYNATYNGNSYQQQTFQIINTGFTGNNVVPAVASVSPVSGNMNGGNSVTISGIGFTGATTVLFGTTPATSFVPASAASTDSQIIAVVPAGTSSGTVDVTVWNGTVSSAVSPADQYTYIGSGPYVSGISPTGGLNSSATAVTITGTNFKTGATVSLTRTGYANVPLTGVSVPSSTSISATIPAGLPAGTWNVLVANTDGQSGIGSNLFTVTAPVPTVTGITPASGLNTTTTAVTITGTYFSSTPPGTTVALKRAGYSNVPLTGVSVPSSTSIFATIPAGLPAGTWNILVTNPDGLSSTSSIVFTVTAPLPTPTVTGVSPGSGQNQKTTAITITGTNFDTVNSGTTASLTRTGYTSVTLNNVKVTSSTSITATVPAGLTAGTWNVVIARPDGKSATGMNLFTVLKKGRK